MVSSKFDRDGTHPMLQTLILHSETQMKQLRFTKQDAISERIFRAYSFSLTFADLIIRKYMY